MHLYQYKIHNIVPYFSETWFRVRVSGGLPGGCRAAHSQEITPPGSQRDSARRLTRSGDIVV